MPPRKTTDLGTLFEALVDDLRIQIAASVDRALSDYGRRLSRIEKRLDELDPERTQVDSAVSRRVCSQCERGAVARGLCSAHYQQWRYRERKTRLTSDGPSERPEDTTPIIVRAGVSRDLNVDN